MVLPELKQLASTLGIKGTGAMRKGQLIDAIRVRPERHVRRTGHQRRRLRAGAGAR